MKKVVSILLAMCLISGVAFASEVQDKGEPTGMATLYAEYFTGNPNIVEDKTEQFELGYYDELSAEILAKGLSDLTGLNFAIKSIQMDGEEIRIDWLPEASLFSKVDDVEPKEGFEFSDTNSLRWFMLDSMYQTIMNNLNASMVYYAMDGGTDIVLEGLEPSNQFGLEVPYVGSNFYYAHDDVAGTDDIINGDGFRFLRLDGRWEGFSQTGIPIYMEMDAYGNYKTYDENNQVIEEGYVMYAPLFNLERYEVYNDTGEMVDQFYFENGIAGLFFNQNGEGFLHEKFSVTQGYPILTGGINLLDLEPIELMKYYNGGYYYYDQMISNGVGVYNVAFTTTETEAEKMTDSSYVIRVATEICKSDIRELEIVYDENTTMKLTYPSYQISWTAGENEDTTFWKALYLKTDTHTYLYAFEIHHMNIEEMEGVWQKAFESLEIS